MSHHECGSCRASLLPSDQHTECITCLGHTHTEAALTGTSCSHCESMSITLLFFKRERSHLTYSPILFPSRAVMEETAEPQGGATGCSKLMSAQHPLSVMNLQYSSPAKTSALV